MFPARLYTLPLVLACICQLLGAGVATSAERAQTSAQAAATQDQGAPERKILRVGPRHPLAAPSHAASKAQDGDIIEIDAGVYTGDVAVWQANNLTIRGVGGLVKLQAAGAHAEGKAIWVVKGNATVIENIEFSEARVPDGNGAGIRLEGAGLTLRHCAFRNNENGILTGENRDSDIVIESSEFAYNGAGEGKTHNIYIGAVRSFTLRYSYSHHARVGHNVKSRAALNRIEYNRIMDEHDGSSSYAIDLPSGGVGIILGNIVQQGPQTQNYTLISYGAEGLRHEQNELYVANNTLVNERAGPARFIFVQQGVKVVRVVNNLFLGRGVQLEAPANLGTSAPAALENNLFASPADFLDAKGYDFRLTPSSGARKKGRQYYTASGRSLRPTAQYRHPLSGQLRAGKGSFDLGALEYYR